MIALDELIVMNAHTGETITLSSDIIAKERHGNQTVCCLNKQLPDWATTTHSDLEVVAAHADGSVECAFEVTYETTESFISTTESVYDTTGIYRVFWDTYP